MILDLIYLFILKGFSTVQQELQTPFIVTEMQFTTYNYNSSLSEQAPCYLGRNHKYISRRSILFLVS